MIGTSRNQGFLLHACKLFKIIARMFYVPPALHSNHHVNDGWSAIFALRLSILLPMFCLALFFSNKVHAQQCPDLGAFYVSPEDLTGWQTAERQLSALVQRCLLSSEYFALLGAAQLNAGNLADALESLERALLLDSANGGAQIDYAQALYLQGQLFSALELNGQVLARGDVPEDLRAMLQSRQDSWQSMTRQFGLQADLLLGYDNNLNGAPSPGQITLTLSGESIILPLNPEFRPVRGPYLNARLGARYRQLAPQHQHNALVELKGRVSEDKASDLLQLSSRYAYIRPGARRSWQLNTGISQLFFGGSALYTATELGGRFVANSGQSCAPYVMAATQHQLFHNQNNLDAIESKLGAGVSCPMSHNAGRQQQLAVEFAALNNSPLRSDRPGGSRNGWQMNLEWQMAVDSGLLIGQLNHTVLDDKRGYSALLADGAARSLRRSYVLLQYQRPLAERTQLLINIYHQNQRSNLELFRSTDSTVEIGVSLAF